MAEELTARNAILKRKRSLLRQSDGKFHDEKLTASVAEFVALEDPTDAECQALSEKLDDYEAYLSEQRSSGSGGAELASVEEAPQSGDSETAGPDPEVVSEGSADGEADDDEEDD